MDEIVLRVEGYPPAKSEALSLLGAGHRHGDRVVRLLDAAREAVARGAEALGRSPVTLTVEVTCPRGGLRSDATNLLGGIADVLQNKAPRGALEHLGDLAQVHLFDDDAQIEELHYSWRPGEQPSYVFRVARRPTP